LDYAKRHEGRPFKSAASRFHELLEPALLFHLDKMQPLLLAAAALFSSAVAGPVQPGQVQTSTGGTIIGHKAVNKTSVTEFLGIRYAEAPVGGLRFAAPKKYVAPQNTVFEASEWVSTVHQGVLLWHVLSIVVSVRTHVKAIFIVVNA
jgi:hypothetical protein